MAAAPDNISMAVFCDFENVALGVRDAKFEKFDIKPVLERLLLKGSIVVKKAYCDWDRYKTFKATMHEANFELIEIPHVRQSGKNSADIRLVVDALDLCYTKSHVNTFVIISGDSDFSPLVSKLRENAKQVIGVGVKQSTSDLLIANCDEFIFYDDLVRESQRNERRQGRLEQGNGRRSDEDKLSKEELETRRTQAIEMAVETFDALLAERGESDKIWASVLKEAIKRRKPGFSESYYGFRAFGNLLEEAQNRGLLAFGRDEKSGAYVYRRLAGSADPVMMVPAVVVAPANDLGTSVLVASADTELAEGHDLRDLRRRGRGPRKAAEWRMRRMALQEEKRRASHPESSTDSPVEPVMAAPVVSDVHPTPVKAAERKQSVPAPVVVPTTDAPVVASEEPVNVAKKPRKTARRSPAKKSAEVAPAIETPEKAAEPVVSAEGQSDSAPAAKKPAKPRKPRKTAKKSSEDSAE